MNEMEPPVPGGFKRVLRSPGILIGGFLLITVVVTFIQIRTPPVHYSSRLISHLIVIFLFNIDFILAASLVMVLIRNIVKLYWDRKRRIFGSGFKSRLIGSFLLMVLIPSILLFVVASGFLNNSVQRWFSFPITDSLHSSLEVAKGYYDQTKSNTVLIAREIADELAVRPQVVASPDLLKSFLSRKRNEYDLAGVELYVMHFGLGFQDPRPVRIGRINSLNVRLLDLPRGEVSQALSKGGEAFVYSTGMGDLIRGVVPVTLPRPQGNKGLSSQGAVVVNYFVPGRFLEKMRSITHAFRDYQALQKFKNPIRESYLLLFLMITLIIIFGAVWFGIYLARKITEPIGALERATEEVAKGNLAVRVPESGQDEFALLIRSFNQMTEDLSDSNRTLQQANSELARRREYTETILEHIGTGVISLDGEGRISTFNQSAEELLDLPRDQAVGVRLSEVNHPAFSLFSALIGKTREALPGGGEEESSLELPSGKTKTFRIRVNRLAQASADNPGGVVIVFDDITALLMAQKAQTWREVAQRIAHEIKNPLTPIQLSAQRLQKKFLDKSEDFPKVFEAAIQTIVDEVQGMKHLVDEFSTFARIPGSTPVPMDIVSLLADVAGLYRSAHKDVEVRTEAEPDLPLLSLDRNAIRRVFVNLFDNAVNAMNESGQIDITVRLAPGREHVTVFFGDSGPGIPPENLDRIFLPYFSTKHHGMGLGLAIVHRILEEHGASISYSNRPSGGALFSLVFPVKPLPKPVAGDGEENGVLSNES